MKFSYVKKGTMKFCIEYNVEFCQTSDVLWNKNCTGIGEHFYHYTFVSKSFENIWHLFVVGRIRKTSAIQNPHSNCAYGNEVIFMPVYFV